MYKIYTTSATSTAFFAAEELKKYLRMMMPRAGDIPVAYDKDAKDGFVLEIMSELGLDTSDAEDVKLDDIVYIDTTPEGGTIAGSNPVALLIAVYRYLRFCGCRWLFPGIDGEWIPTVDALPSVNYRKLADHRYRGQCNEGAEFQPNMMETIDFTPKIGMNTYMLEFDIPSCYYNSYYDHNANTCRKPEPITEQTVLQWKRQCEAEIQKRGLHFHDMGHGWTSEPFGLDSKIFDSLPTDTPPETMARLAMVNGKRDFWYRVIDTNFCMSNAENRDIVVQYIADYAEKQNNVDFLHIWLADGYNNHCECEECRKKITPDWYVILLNDIDAELTRRNLSTHLVFIVYTETFYPPLETKINNEKRFTMLYAPISRLYSETYAEIPDESAVKPFNLNKNIPPRGMAECLGYLNAWKKVWSGDCFCYEYHFWRTQCYDPSGMFQSKIIHDDIAALRSRGLHGIVEDGSQRSYFPTGFSYYVYGETLFDNTVSYEYLLEDYFSHAFGENWRKVVDFLNKIQDHLQFTYISGDNSSDPEKGKYYNPEMAELAKKVPKITSEFASVIKENLVQDYRASSVSWQLLEYFKTYVDLFAKAVEYKAVGDDENAKITADKLFATMSELEIYIERWYDQSNMHNALIRSGIFSEEK